MTISDQQTPWQRLSDRFSGLLDPVDPRAGPTEPAPEFKQWMIDVSAVVSVCMAYSGLTEYGRVAKEAVHVPAHLPPALHAMYVRNQRSSRTARVATTALKGGWHALVFGGLFYGVDALLGIAYARQCKENTAVSGFATGALYGGLLPGDVVFKAGRASLGGGVGAGVGLLVGWLTHDLAASLSKSADSPNAPPE